MTTGQGGEADPFSFHDGMWWIVGKHEGEEIWASGKTKAEAVAKLISEAMDWKSFTTGDPVADWSRVNTEQPGGAGDDAVDFPDVSDVERFDRDLFQSSDGEFCMFSDTAAIHRQRGEWKRRAEFFKRELDGQTAWAATYAEERDEARKALAVAEKRIDIMRHRECLCPDCRDKVKPGECPRCAMQTAQRERDAARAALARATERADRAEAVLATAGMTAPGDWELDYSAYENWKKWREEFGAGS